MSPSNRITNVAIVGAGGRSGSFIVSALLQQGKHTITALTRTDSTTPLPPGILVQKIDYSNPSSLVNALLGQDALIITMSTTAPREQQQSLIRAAGEAGVPFILPNEWGPDTAHESLAKDVPLFNANATTRSTIQNLGKSAYIGLVCGFWYEWSLGIADAYGFDLNNKSLTLFDDGDARVSTSTWPQVGRAVAALLSLPVKPESGSDQGAVCLEAFSNKMVYVKSFTVSQKEMFASVLRVTGTKAEEWKITHQPCEERYAAGAAALRNGERMGFVHMMYTRVFYPDGCGDFESKRGTANEMLGLPEEDIDEATKIAVERARTGPWS